MEGALGRRGLVTGRGDKWWNPSYKFWGEASLTGEQVPGRQAPYGFPPHFQDDKPSHPRLPARKLDTPGPTHYPIVHLPPEGMQPKLRLLAHQRAKPQDQVLGAVVEAVWSLL